MAIIFYLTAKTNSAMVLSAATFVGFIPQAILGPFAGAFVDRHSRKKVMIGADLLIAAAGGLLAVVAVFIDPPIWIIMLVLFIRSIGNAYHTPASSAVTPLMVPQEQLTKCAGYTQTMSAVVSLISPAAAAALYSVWPLSYIIMLDIAGAVLACGIVALLPIPNPPVQKSERKARFLQDMNDGYRVLKENKPLFALLWIGTAYMFFFMPIAALFPLMSMSYFNGTPVHASIAEIAFAGGMLAGGILLSIWGGFKNRILSIGLSILVTSPFYGVQNALIQERIAPEYLGRVFAMLSSVISFAMPMGLLCSGIFAEQIGVEKWFLLCGIGIIAVSMLVFVLPVLRDFDRKTKVSE